VLLVHFYISNMLLHLETSQRLLGFTRNSSGDEIANMNFLYDDIMHVLQNTIDLCINSVCLPN